MYCRPSRGFVSFINRNNATHETFLEQKGSVRPDRYTAVTGLFALPIVRRKYKISADCFHRGSQNWQRINPDVYAQKKSGVPFIRLMLVAQLLVYAEKSASSAPAFPSQKRQ